MRQYETFELTFQGEVLSEDYAQIALTAEFACGGEKKTVRGFYDGDGVYKVRFLPERPGEYRWTVSGTVNAEGIESCEPAMKNVHGPVKAVDTHFEYADGTLFFPFGTTVYALASQDDALVEQTLETLKAAPFNKLRMCVFPKHYDYNHKEPPFYAFKKNEDGSWDVGRPCIAFWRRFERILDRIGDLGIQIDLILFHPYDRWGFGALKQEDNLRYLDYLLRRLSAKPGIWWSLANEYDLSRSKTLSDWEEIENFVAENDPYGHLLSCHNCFAHWDFSRPRVTHASIQTKSLTQIPVWLQRFHRPVMIDECCYEGDIPQPWGSISGKEMVNRFWRSIASGAYCTHGETFLSEDEVLWWARGGALTGESPKRIAFLREIIEALPGPLSPVEGGLEKLASLTPEQLSAMLPMIPPEHRESMMPFLNSMRRMDPVDLALHLGGEHAWAAHCGEDAFLWFYDLQCFAEQTLQLPAEKRYRVEWIDVWEMTRTVLTESASGNTKIRLPGKEGIAVLATRIDEH